MLYTILWRAAVHDRDKLPLTVQDLKVPQVSSVFDAFQKQVIVTSVTTLELKDIFIRDQQKMQALSAPKAGETDSFNNKIDIS